MDGEDDVADILKSNSAKRKGFNLKFTPHTLQALRAILGKKKEKEEEKQHHHLCGFLLSGFILNPTDFERTRFREINQSQNKNLLQSPFLSLLSSNSTSNLLYICPFYFLLFCLFVCFSFEVKTHL